MRNFLVLAGFAALATAATTPGWTAMPNSGFVAPDTQVDQQGLPAADQLNDTDRLFVRLLAAGNNAEVKLGKLVPERSRRDEVRAFGQKMVEAHSAAGEQLDGQIARLGVVIPKGKDPDHEKARQSLESLKGDAFDVAYINNQVAEHQKTAGLLEWELSGGQNAGLLAFASKLLPDVGAHLAMARDIQARLPTAEDSGAAPK